MPRGLQQPILSSLFFFHNYSQKKEAINKRVIIEEVANIHDLSIAKSERIVNTVFDTIVEAVLDGKQARFSNFGSFDSYMSKPRTGRNPSTGESIEIPSTRRIRFKAYDAFKKAKMLLKLVKVLPFIFVININNVNDVLNDHAM